MNNQLSTVCYLVLKPRYYDYGDAERRKQARDFTVNRVTQRIPEHLGRGEIAVQMTVRVPRGAFQPPKIVTDLEIPDEAIISGEPLEVTVSEPVI